MHKIHLIAMGTHVTLCDVVESIALVGAQHVTFRIPRVLRGFLSDLLPGLCPKAMRTAKAAA